MTRALASLTLLLSLGTGCNDDDKKDTATDGTGGGYWAVGEDASMLRLGASGDVWLYPLAVEGDLLAIACKGKEAAVAVGEDGLVLRTEDGGAEWSVIEVGTRAPLRGVALSAGTSVFVVGEDVVLRSQDLGRSFAPVAGAEGSWQAVATTAAGTTAWLANAAGEVWRLQGEALTPSFTNVEGPLSGIAASPDGSVIVAVGAGGLVLRSDDAGARWSSVPAPTRRGLKAVRLAEERVVAVGEAGVVLRIDGQGAAAAEHLDPGLALRALHLAADGRGHAVGDHGVSLATLDAGKSWTPDELGLDVALLGIDDLDGEPRL